MLFLWWHWEEGGLVISNKGDGPRLNVFERHFFLLDAIFLKINFVTQFYFAWPPSCKANEL
jgi:hypothetical protein